MQAILMVGEQRSGSNLLRLILNSSNEIAAPHPPHILQNLMPLMDSYGNLNNSAVMGRLVNDVCRLVENNPVPWEGVDTFDRDEILALCRENSLIAVFDAVMTVYAQKQNSNAWLCKSMQNIRWARELNSYLDKPKFIYLYRDPRDVALSFSKAVIGDKHPYFVAQKWLELQELCLEAERYLKKDQFKRVCYEELTNEPERVIKDLCKFLGIQFVPAMLDFHRSNEANRTATQSTLWSNLTKPIIANNSKKFMQDMSEEHIYIIESLTGHILDKLGYQRHLVKPGQETKFTKEHIKVFHTENERLKGLMSQQTDPEDLKRRQHLLNILNDIRHSTLKAIAAV